ncbi:Elongation factor G, mitochondrial [Oopsacas minuta]|uniref:Elongation factor G, mitochondrial n=1 Tax=Oopsacas minuta TaxID=111878 RepID=A0AAV7K3X9_9METZ|nr:Elongation factor G, mitochondrial [Oopsacas minuta]
MIQIQLIQGVTYLAYYMKCLHTFPSCVNIVRYRWVHLYRQVELYSTKQQTELVGNGNLIERTRNIGISAHIDSGKTTVSERILFYSGRISEMHEVKGKDHVGATMDSMELERQRGITIQSAATQVEWKDHCLNLIDTPGHVDFTIEVERALRVLDSAVLVLCGVGGVQSQTHTVDRQMRRYQIPHLAFINKLDRTGADPDRVIKQMKAKLGHNAAALHVPIGLEQNFTGIADVISMKAYYFDGAYGEVVREESIPYDLQDICEARYLELLEALANVDEQIGELFLEEKYPSQELLKSSIRRATISRKFVPVVLGSALKNKGIQPLLDCVLDYMPNPREVDNWARLEDDNGKVQKYKMETDPSKSFVGLAFKIEMGRYGQLTYLRVYQGTLKKGMWLLNTRSKKRIRVPRSVLMHADKMQDIQTAESGAICAMFGVECRSGDTFVSEESPPYSMESIHVPEPVISQALKLKFESESKKLSRGLWRFQLEDPTFRVEYNEESRETIISGMGELHLDIYVQRLRNEFDCHVNKQNPQVAYRETISDSIEFSHIHKKQTGGAGQYASVKGRLIPLLGEDNQKVIFDDRTIGNNIPREFIPAIEKGFMDAVKQGVYIGQKISGIKMMLDDGKAHLVDSSELAFRIASRTAVQNSMREIAVPRILEPIMTVEISAPVEFQGEIQNTITKKRGTITGTDSTEGYFILECEVPLKEMFGYSTTLRSMTQGKGEYSMEFLRYDFLPIMIQEQLMAVYQKELEEKKK